jgi:hypothetical protein
MVYNTGSQGYSGAEAAAAVAERGLAGWREAKVAWLDAFANFEATSGGKRPGKRPGATSRSRSGARTATKRR